FLGVGFATVDASILPGWEQARRVSNALGRDYAADVTNPITIASAAPDSSAASALAARVRALPGVRAVESPRRVGPDTWRIDAVPASGRLTASSERLVRQIRGLPEPFYVGVA